MEDLLCAFKQVLYPLWIHEGETISSLRMLLT